MGLGRSLMNEQDNCNQEPIPHFSSAITKAVPKEKGANFEGSSASKLKVAHPHCLPATHQEICQNASAEKYFVTIHHVFSQLKQNLLVLCLVFNFFFNNLKLAIFNRCATKIFKMCNIQLFSQEHFLTSFPLDWQIKNDNSQHNNSCLA